MYAAKAVAAFVSLVITALMAAPGVVPVDGTVKLVLTIVAILAGAITTYAIPNRGAVTVVRRVE